MPITNTAFATLNAAQRDAVLHGEPRGGGGIAGRAVAGHRRRRHRQDQHAGAPRRAPAARRRAAGAHAAAHVHAPRRARDDAPRAERHGRGAGGPGRCDARRVPDHLRLPWSGTFHSIGNRLIREYAPRLGLDPGFSVLDRGDAADLMDVVRHRLGFSKTVKRFPRKDTCLGIYSHRVNTQRPLRHTLETAYPWCLDWEEQLTALCRAYVEAKLEQQVLDYDDLLLYWHVMTADPALAAEHRRALRPRAGRRVPGHQRRAGRDPAAAEARRRRTHRGRRRRAVDLFVPRRRRSTTSSSSRSGSRRRRASSRSRKTTARRSRCSTPPTR